MWLLLNDAQRFILHVRPSSIINNTIDITAISAVDDDGKLNREKDIIKNDQC